MVNRIAFTVNMDPSLLRERELFKKRALSTPAVEKKKKDVENSISKDDASKRKGKPQPAPSSKLDVVSYKTMTGSSQYKFGVLAKIVKHMKSRHQEGDDHPLTLDEILDETNQLDVGSKVKQWLLTEALSNNPKLEATPDGRYLFRATYKIRDKKSLLRLLKQHDLKGMGGILLEDVQESLPHCEKALKALQNELIYITRPIDKKKILFYNDKTANFYVEDEFQKLWRAVAGIRSMQDHGQKKAIVPMKRKKPSQRRNKNKKPRDNEHLADVLENYEDK
ncbi:hypothetical protein J437_LFUL004050 [Ladona fulva]|uniref:Transcription initiation factor IIE subunit beta n=1 Tax=Ladona fulva TaxID=123851 RepID=A0A8K0NT41_LADFU|nr:hypothetical protein J437_LFUL004050 [Ladona fulva]